jgi:hypothetical protein
MPENKIDYSARDYDSLLAQLLAKKAEKLPGYTETSSNDLGILLIELFALLGDSLSYYQDRILQESFLSECTERTSALKLARLLGYVPSTNQAATVDVIFTLSSNPSGVTLVQGTQVATVPADGETRKVYSLSADLSIPALSLSGTGSCSQGEIVTEVYSGTGEANQEIRLINGSVVSGSVDVTINSVAWTEVLNLADKDDDDQVYTVLYSEDDTATIVFGDGVNGASPANGASIIIQYLNGGGEEGRVSANKLTVFLGSEPLVSSVNNASASSGGASKEGLSSIKVNAPASLKTAGRAVTATDYETLALGVAGVQQVKAIGYGGFVRISIAPVGGGLPSALLKNQVAAAIDAKRPIDTHVVVEDPVYVSIDVTLIVTGKRGYKQSVLQSRVETVLSALLDPNQTIDGIFINGYGEDIFLSDVYQTIASIDGVDRLTISTLKKSTDASGALDVDLRLNEIRTAGTVVVTVTGGSTDAQFEDQVRKLRKPETLQ